MKSYPQADALKIYKVKNARARVTLFDSPWINALRGKSVSDNPNRSVSDNPNDRGKSVSDNPNQFTGKLISNVSDNPNAIVL